MEDFKTYKPLLSSIKNEYELVIHYQQEQIRKLQPLEVHSLNKSNNFWIHTGQILSSHQVTLGTVEEECERKIMAIKQEEKTGTLMKNIPNYDSQIYEDFAG